MAIVTVHSNGNSIDWGVTGNERIIQNVRNILRTRKFEVPFMREMGVNPDYIDASVIRLRNEISADVIELIKTYEERVTVLNVEVEMLNENGELDISVEMEV